jgi:hypothetical protein
MLDTQIGLSTVGFVDLTSGIPMPLGSGTLVRTKTIQGFLTCGHVALPIARQSEIGDVLFPIRAGDLQQIRLPVADFMKTRSFGTISKETKGEILRFSPSPTSTYPAYAQRGQLLTSISKRVGPPKLIQTAK